ncbi:TetR/AcrR family transcriptional regulator [Pseudomonas sp. GD03860]|uniref:TetR/AcrR family transcriptional regulator n=1 Tax=Pseudomonas TaxID=286 RepID=UPI002363E32A|nr:MULTISPECIES: TetR/AcrR family transcriptional regulator [Pseudomonas]MDD2058417.1 TetR/AcrR family transcriptional regulator [Pseudomonas putida]MDH0640229.1 TetR/AcrR family transcriptional regulator [Pseudomonas sp. GD03860]
MGYIPRNLTPSGDPIPPVALLAEASQVLEHFGQLRKQPRQARSEALVVALRDAARHLLEHEGRPALTLIRLSEYAGVAASSIYEYFPSMDSLVDVLFAEYCDETGQQMQADVLQLPSDASLFDGVCVITRHALGLRHRLHSLDPETNSRQVRYYEQLRLLPRDDGYMPPLDGSARLLFKRFSGDIQARDPDKSLYLFCRTLHLLVRSIAMERPHYLGDESTLREVAHMLHSLLTQA